MSELTIVVAGMPAPQGSKRHVGHGRMVESSARVEPWRQDVRTAAAKAMLASPDFATLISLPVSVEVSFYLPRPKGHYRTGRNACLLRGSAPAWPAGRPDTDKLARAILDALTDTVYLDDAQVCVLGARKLYAAAGTAPGATILLTELARWAL